MTSRARLLVIDPQNDFCDLALPAKPALPVPGAHADMTRLATFITDAADRLERVGITLDTHQRLDIAHPGFWRRRDGGPVEPFTEVTSDVVKRGELKPRRDADQPRVLRYLDALEARGRYRLMVWPVHCEIGTWGHNVHDAIQTSTHVWEDRGGVNADYFWKGQNPWTEHYSAAMAEVPDAADVNTLLNQELIDWVNAGEVVFIGGEASSHCVRATVEHLIEHAARSERNRCERLVLLTDCMSPVAGFETQAAQFLADARSAGVRLLGSTQAIETLAA